MQRQIAGHFVAAFDLLEETLRLTNLGALSPGAPVNLERALQASSRLSGHFVQGHVDTSAEILTYAPSGQDHQLTVALPERWFRPAMLKDVLEVEGFSGPLLAARIRKAWPATEPAKEM